MPSRSQYALMSAKDKNIVLLVCFSSAVAFFDFLIYLYIADVVATNFFPVSVNPTITKIQGLGLFAIGYLARPIGGLIFGRYGDIKGRKPVLLISMLVTVISLAAMAMLPTYAQWGLVAPALFIILRLIQGIAFGLYVPLAWVFVAEHVPRQYSSVACSYVTASFYVGVLFSNAFFLWLTNSMTPDQLADYGWRLPFLTGAILSLVPLLAWRWIDESPFFVEMKKSKPDNYIAKPFRLLFKHCKHSIFIGMVLTIILSSITTVIVLLLPDLIELRFALDSDLFGFSHSLGIVFMVLGCIFYGLISNQQNFGKVLAIGSTLLIIQMLLFFYHLQASGDYILIMYSLLGFSAGIVGMVPAILVRLFPTNVRLTGMAFCYNMAYGIVGVLVPFGLGYATLYVSFSPALYIAFVGFIGIIMGIYFYNLPEFKKIDEVI
ncbi:MULTISPECIES: MFS transporter [Psychrobacter]|uniref:MFS transporter n=1 Tax=Psychrobacter alimentarius TaxID=261164 RepID=A0ABM5ZZD3_9GAMM|nr:MULTISPECIES: MFS transporter [Psychrobacter]AMT97376.1 MFS transporter [Psychrobacter alimentarius]QCB30318.1 MFS transporter [Psychrobacter sp. PAMC27889]